MDASAPKPTVLVTGGSGYLAGWIIVELLRQGHAVRTTIRDLARADKVQAVLARHSATNRLTFHAANLLADAGWDAAAASAEQVIHVASPMPLRDHKGTDLVKAAREGVGRVLEAARRAEVRHVVMTSSLAAAMPAGPPGPPTDESVWTNLGPKSVSEYARSKTLAEQDAWEFAQASGGALTLTTILPGMVQGPVLGPEISGSLEIPLMMLRGKLPLLPRVAYATVDTRDVVELHVRSLADPRVRGWRILAASHPLWFREVAEILRSSLGDGAAKVSTREAPDLLIRVGALFNADMKFMAPDLGRRRSFSSARAEALLGRPLRTPEEAVRTAGEGLVEARLV